MGKRKERRLAAAMGVGRRVKLDLFAEPSGDLGGSPAEEVGGGVDSKNDAGLPKSPSSSGQQSANPLLLLGQYSDDDMEVQDSDDNQEDAQADNDEPIKSNGKEQEEQNVPTTEDPSSKKNSELVAEKDVALGESLQVQGSLITGESSGAGTNRASDEKHLELPQQCDPSVSGLHASGDDAKSCWKMVPHEGSNSYYYWNTLTGETSWEVPADFAQVMASTCEPQTQAVEGNSQGSMYALTGTGCATEVSYTLFSSGSEDAQPVQECKIGETQLNSSSDAIGASHQENVTLGNYSSYVPPSIPIAGGWGTTSSAYNVYVHGAVTNNQDGLAAADLPSDLVRRSESLLARLSSLRGCEGNTSQEHAWTSKYISEIEIRLFDLNSLLSCGSILAPFWLHSERQLKRLEDAINSEIGSYVESELKNEISSVNLPSYEEEGKQENVNVLADLDEDLKKAITTSDVTASTEQDAGLVQDGTEASQEGISFDETAAVANLNSEPEAPAVEEVDMDIDMEAEETSLPGSPAVMEAVGNHTFPSQQVAEPSSPTGQHPLASADESFTPLDEHFVPPPPPDSEEIPPPPPDDPPEPFCPPLPTSYPDSVQPVTYTANYSTVYPDPNYSYYGHTGVSLPNQPVYYDGVPSSQAEAVAALSNSIGSTVYYGLQVAAAPGVPTELSSSFQAASAPSSYDSSLPSNLVGSISAQTEMASIQSANVAYALHGTAEPINSQASTSSMPAAESTATKEGVSASSASTRAASASLSAMSTVSHSSVAAAKPQARATRVKKRTVSVASSLRSNKKVSSLVDKWKAAKEELEEAEEEPEDALAILEKKRQREIEEWRAQQIASGEARENANFQPLGGDWRERVKRRRAQKAASGENPVQETVSENKRPDLTKHTKGLPPGWQAYWDDSSKQVYYGNTITSETSWTRPS